MKLDKIYCILIDDGLLNLKDLEILTSVVSDFKYSQLSPCGYPAITDTLIIRTADKFRAKINYRRLTEINSRYYGLSLQRTLT